MLKPNITTTRLSYGSALCGSIPFVRTNKMVMLCGVSAPDRRERAAVAIAPQSQ